MNQTLNNVGAGGSCVSSSSVHSTPKRKNILSKCVDRQVTTITPSDEVKRWINYDLTLADDDDDVLGFWSKNAAMYPSLARLAKKVLSIPASNTTIERLFSSTKLTITDRRTRLGTEKVSFLSTEKYWF